MPSRRPACSRNCWNKLGHTVLTHHLLGDDADAQEGQLTERAVFERDVWWLESADVLIARAIKKC